MDQESATLGVHVHSPTIHPPENGIHICYFAHLDVRHNIYAYAFSQPHRYAINQYGKTAGPSMLAQDHVVAKHAGQGIRSPGY